MTISGEDDGVLWVSSLSCKGSLVVVLRALCKGMGVSGVADCVEPFPCNYEVILIVKKYSARDSSNGKDRRPAVTGL